MTERIQGATELLGLVGGQISRSQSPQIHNGWLGRLGLNAVYVPFPSGEPLQAIRGLLCLSNFRGANITSPWKSLECLGSLGLHVHPHAAAVGAANLLYLGARGWELGNTDTYGLFVALRAHGPWPRDCGWTAVLGGGGGARCARWLGQALGMEVVLFGRNPRKLAASFPHNEVAPLSAFPAGLPGRGPPALVVSTLPPCPQRDCLAFGALLGARPLPLVVDLVYGPSALGIPGLPVVTGEAMLRAQAEASFYQWYGQWPEGVPHAYEEFQVLAGTLRPPIAPGSRLAPAGV